MSTAAPSLSRTIRVPRDARGLTIPVGVFNKDPNAVLDFYLDYTDWLEGADTLASTAWTIPGGITKDSDTVTASLVGIWLSAGVDATTYDLLCRVTTTAGRIDDRTVRVIVGNR